MGKKEGGRAEEIDGPTFAAHVSAALTSGY